MAQGHEVSCVAGQGAIFALAELGFITGDDQYEWIRRLLDAAGLEYDELEVRADASSTAEAEEHDEDDGDWVGTWS